MTEDEVKQEIHILVESICNLAKVNRLTGIWDHIRFEESKKNIKEVDVIKIVQSEKNSRYNVEQRAVYRKSIDKQIMILFKGSNN